MACDKNSREGYDSVTDAIICALGNSLCGHCDPIGMHIGGWWGRWIFWSLHWIFTVMARLEGRLCCFTTRHQKRPDVLNGLGCGLPGPIVSEGRRASWEMVEEPSETHRGEKVIT